MLKGAYEPVGKTCEGKNLKGTHQGKGEGTRVMEGHLSQYAIGTQKKKTRETSGGIESLEA